MECACGPPCLFASATVPECCTNDEACELHGVFICRGSAPRLPPVSSRFWWHPSEPQLPDHTDASCPRPCVGGNLEPQHGDHAIAKRLTSAEQHAGRGLGGGSPVSSPRQLTDFSTACPARTGAAFPSRKPIRAIGTGGLPLQGGGRFLTTPRSQGERSTDTFHFRRGFRRGKVQTLTAQCQG